MKKNVCHLTSAHSRYDTRIFIKECVSLQKNGYNVTLIVSDGKGNEFKEGIHILDIGKFFDLGNDTSRLSRIRKTQRLILKAALATKADIFHFHDPELIIIGYILKVIYSKQVIYDVHEDIPRQIFNKPYIKNIFKPVLSKCLELVESFFSKRYSMIIAATPFIFERFKKINPNTVNVNNFPIINKGVFQWSDKKNEICYAGVITVDRGIHQLIKAMDLLSCRLNLAGQFWPETLLKEVSQYPGWSKVNYLGVLDKIGVEAMYNRSKVGIVTLLPRTNYLDSLPVKMFEYMTAGIPIVASNFPYWEDILVQTNCGFCTDPENPKAISVEINKLLKDDALSQAMGENGKRASDNFYNWENEEKILLNAYFNI
jgi:glycosyltransferase involved in cell wall biosynthesis